MVNAEKTSADFTTTMKLLAEIVMHTFSQIFISIVSIMNDYPQFSNLMCINSV